MSKTNNLLNFRAIANIFGVKVAYTSQGELRGCCPIHGGDNQSALTLYEKFGVWKCWTHHCEEEWGKSMFGFIKALISLDNPSVTSRDVDDWMKQGNWEMDAPVSYHGISRYKEIKSIAPRSHVLQALKIPSEYYLRRGFSPKVLKKYDVGDCVVKNKMMSGRAVIPCYDLSHKWLIGCSGRLDTDVKELRWRHSKNFPRSQTLYNSWFASSCISATGVAILTEAPAKVWKLEECGIHNALGIFGTKFVSEQKKLLSRMGVTTVVLLLDNDEAGREATNNVAKDLSGLYNIVIPRVSFEDLDETPLDIIKKEVLPAIQNL